MGRWAWIAVAALAACLAVAAPAVSEDALPDDAPIDQAVVVTGGACTIPPRRTTNDSQLVVTPSFHVTLVCHVHPS